LELQDNENFRIIYATNVFGGLNSVNDGRLVFSVDTFRTKVSAEGNEEASTLVREHLIEIHLSPSTWKSITGWMSQHISNYEKKYGFIPTAAKDEKTDATEKKRLPLYG